MSKFNNRMFAVTAISVDFAGRVTFSIKKLFWNEPDADRYLKENTSAQPEDVHLEIHEIEAPE